MVIENGLPTFLATIGQRSRLTRRVVSWVLLVSLSALFAPGCHDADRPPGLSRRAVPIAEVPEAVVNAAKTTLPGIEFNEAWKNLDRDGKLHSYEIRGRSSNGKVREARVSAEGKVLETE